MDAKVVLSEMSAKRHVTYVVSRIKIIYFTRLKKKIHEYSILSPILQRMIINQNLNVKPQIVVKLVNMNLMNIINVNAFAVMMRTH